MCSILTKSMGLPVNKVPKPSSTVSIANQNDTAQPNFKQNFNDISFNNMDLLELDEKESNNLLQYVQQNKQKDQFWTTCTN